MRELRHDFRAVYGVAYDEVPTDEAVDLVLTLPRGSAWRAAGVAHGEWGDAREDSADVVDMLARVIQLVATGSTEGAWRVTRPSDLRRMDAERARAAEARRRMDETEWEEVDGG